MDNRFSERLKQKNLRITNSRSEIFRVLQESSVSLSAKDVFAIIQKKSDLKTDQVSVYRNLTLFSQIGLAHRMQDGKYSACMQDEDQHQHLHVLANCSRCGNTFEIASHDDKICQLIKKMKGFIDSFEELTGVTFQGLCKRCCSSSD